LPVSRKGARCCTVELADELEQLVIKEVLEGKLPLASVPGVGLPEHGVPVARDHLPRLQETPHELLHLVVRGVKTNLLHNLLHEDDDLLVRDAMEGSCEA